MRNLIPGITRRDLVGVLLANATPAALGAGNWTREWDKALIDAAVVGGGKIFNPTESMVTRKLGAGYQYHTNLRSMMVHPIRESLHYALYLIEAGDEKNQQRAENVLDRVLALQDTDPGSKWYGLWGWYMEEPPPKMSPADWNWADFNGATLLMIEARHGKKLPPALVKRIRTAISHAAYSIRRRNVSMGYTNIAVQGTFVTLAAAELLGSADLKRYATDRMRRLAQYIDTTGSFNEYNSPTYANVTIANITRMRMMLGDEDMLDIANRIHHRVWLHLARHWHAPTRQLAGPMSRCYRTDIGKPLWLQKALGGLIAFGSLEDLRRGEAGDSGDIGILDYQCPRDLIQDFLELRRPRQHRELFLTAEPPLRPVQGTTYLTPNYCLGTANRSDFWVQRRPLLAYWGSFTRPAHYLQLRLLKDDYDFSSGLFYSVQEHNHALSLVTFRSPGGDRHISLDPLRNGEFQARRLRLRADLASVPPSALILVNGEPARLPVETMADSSVAVDLGSVRLWLAFQARFGESLPGGQLKLSLAREDGLLTISVDFHRSLEPRTLRWSDINIAWAAVRLVLDDSGTSLDALNQRYSRYDYELQESGSGLAVLQWETPAGQLRLHGRTNVSTIENHNEAFREYINGKPVPLTRLSDERLL